MHWLVAGAAVIVVVLGWAIPGAARESGSRELLLMLHRSFGLLIIGLVHGWWATPPADIPHAEGAFLMAWAIVLTVWFFLSLVLPAIFTLLLALVDIALWCLVIGIWNTSAGPQQVAGWAVSFCCL